MLYQRREALRAGVRLTEKFGGVPTSIRVVGMAAGAVVADQLEGERTLETVLAQAAGGYLIINYLLRK